MAGIPPDDDSTSSSPRQEKSLFPFGSRHVQCRDSSGEQQEKRLFLFGSRHVQCRDSSGSRHTQCRDSSGSRHAQCRDNCLTLSRTLLAILVALCSYVFVIQVLRQDELATLSERQQSRLTYIPARRGAILDRHGAILNYSIPQYDLAIRLDKLRDPRDTRSATLNKAQAAIADLAVFLGPDYYLFRPERQTLEHHIQTNAPLPFVLWTNLDGKTIARFEEHRQQFPYAELTLTWCRQYTHEESAPHVRGFVKRVPARQKDLPDSTRLLKNVGDMAGASGVELAFDHALAGESGYQKIQTDVLSFRSGTVDSKGATPGKDIRLTIDIRWQETAEGLLQATGKPSALVMMDAKTGEILVMASMPKHALPPRGEDASLDGGYANRATAGFYPPGSTIKPFIALAALEQGVIRTEDKLHCPGFFELPDGRRIKCSSKYGHGSIDVTQAIAMSCNTFFCELSTRLGAKGLHALAGNPNYSSLFGRETGIGCAQGEIPGVLFGPDWVEKKRFDDVAWREGDAANAGIGQGAWIVTPLQMALYACAITTGRLFKPTLISNGKPELRQRLQWSPEVWRPVLQGLLDCVQSPRGTGRRLAIDGLSIYAKTGTAEHGAGREPHAWMFAVYPANDPQFTIACILEEGGHGGETVAPLLRQFILVTNATQQ